MQEENFKHIIYEEGKIFVVRDVLGSLICIKENYFEYKNGFLPNSVVRFFVPIEIKKNC